MRIHVIKLNEYKTSELNLEKWFQAVSDNDIELIKDYIKKGIDINSQDNHKNTALILASFHDNFQVVLILLKHSDINVNAQDDINSTALIDASKNGNLDSVQELLNHPKIDVNIQDNYGNTALSYAIEKEYKETEKLLREAGAVE